MPPPNTPGTSQRVVTRVAHLLRQRVIHGQYAAGERMPTERDLARELSVSRMSVSRALNRLAEEGIIEQHVGAGTRVLPDAASRLPPGAVAIIHRGQVGPSRSEPSLIIQGAADAFAQRQFPYAILPMAGADPSAREPRAIHPEEIAHLQDRFAGVLFVEANCPDRIAELERRRFPVVVANLEGDLDVSSTWVNHCMIAQSSVQLCAAMGHTRIGLLITTPERAFYGKTLEGYRLAMHELGLNPDEQAVAFCPSSSPLEAYLVAKEMLKKEPTAIVTGRDLHAEGVCRAARESGRVIGRDLSVIGFDDVSWAQDVPFLTTFREPCHELGAAAAEMLIDRLAGGWKPPERRQITAPLILRRSLGVPAVPNDAQTPSVRCVIS